MNEINIQEYEYYMKNRPHVVILGAGASCAAIPSGDKYGRKISAMSGFIDKLGLNEIISKVSIYTKSDNLEDIYMKSDKLKTSAKNNTQQDFEFSYFDDIDDALIEGLSQNQDFFSMLLSNDEMKHQVMGIFSDEIYKSLRESV